VHRPDGTLVFVHWMRLAVRPLTWAVDASTQGVSDLVAGLAENQRLAATNQQLRQDLEDVRLRNTILETDLQATREALEVALATPMTTFEVGRALYRDLGRGLLVVSIASGADIRRDAAVVAAGGLVGRVIRVERDRCWVESLATPGAAVAIRTADGGGHGIIEGIGRGTLRVQYLGRQAAVTRGELLSTSGADGLYPPDLPVARVTSVRETEAPFLTVRADAVVNMADVRAVAILTGTRPVTGDLPQ
jgi:rod shape-determining protein MreC